ncbi:MAG: hypothetical protein HQL11_01300 [Candidatus Omnitrophica bacterium]|nr:hypothetical protein [Candidatus Omnitrophota bacterium]
MQRLRKEITGVRLVITVDNGISGIEEIAFLKKRGIDTIVVDHHEPGETLPDALAMIVPFRAVGVAATHDLAACGLAWKLAQALFGSVDDVLDEMELAAIGTVADMAPLAGENRLIVRFGLERLSRTRLPGLAALLTKTKLAGKTIRAFHAAFMLAPRLNAVGRMGSALEAFRLLVTEESVEARNLADLLDEENRQRQKIEKEVCREAAREVERTHHFMKDHIIVVANPRWHEGVVGIVATRLVDKYHRPALVLCEKGETAKGSGRSLAGIDLFHLLERSSEHCLEFGGHAAACGFTLKTTEIEPFRRKINDLARAEITPADLAARLTIDLEAPLEAFNAGVLKDFVRMEPFGIRNPRPVFLTRRLRVKSEPRKSGWGGQSFWLENEAGTITAEGVFSDAELAGRVRKGAILDVVHSPKEKSSNGLTTLELSVKDLRAAG